MNPLPFRRVARLSLVLLIPLLPSETPCVEGAREQMDFGVKAAKRGLWREALFRWDKALKLDPENARLLNNLAVAYETSGDFEKADALYQKALRVSPGNKDIQQNYELFTSYYKQILSRRDRREGRTEAPRPPGDDGVPPSPAGNDAPPPR